MSSSNIYGSSVCSNLHTQIDRQTGMYRCKLLQSNEIQWILESFLTTFHGKILLNNEMLFNVFNPNIYHLAQLPFYKFLLLCYFQSFSMSLNSLHYTDHCSVYSSTIKGALVGHPATSLRCNGSQFPVSALFMAHTQTLQLTTH